MFPGPSPPLALPSPSLPPPPHTPPVRVTCGAALRKVSFHVLTICPRLHVSVKRHLFGTRRRRGFRRSQLRSRHQPRSLTRALHQTASLRGGRAAAAVADGPGTFAPFLVAARAEMKVSVWETPPAFGSFIFLGLVVEKSRKRHSARLQSVMTSHIKVKQGLGAGWGGGVGRRGAPSRGPSGLIITGRNLGLLSTLTRRDFGVFFPIFSFFLLFFLLSGQKMFNSSALGANYTAEKNDPR